MKSLPSQNVLVRPFKTYKTHEYTITYLQTGNPEEVRVNEAWIPPTDWQISPPADPINYGTSISKYALFDSLEQMFYPTVSTRPGFPQQITSGSNILIQTASWEYNATGSLRRALSFDRQFTLPTSSYVINIAQQAFGEQVFPNSVLITTPSSTASFYDDGQGRLLSSVDSSVVGNIFYSFGIAVVGQISQNTGSVITNQGLYLTTGSQLTVEYQSQYTIYEHTILCTLKRGEFNYSTNPSFQMFASSSVSGSIKLFDALASGTLTPYITTVGLADIHGQVLAIAKVPYPIRRLIQSDQTFVVRFDI